MRMYRDPAEAYERTEASTCKGCAFELSVRILGEDVKHCGKKKRYGRRCKLYVER